MAGFNNPFSPKPDYASGFSDIASQIMQMLIMNKMFKGNGQQQGQGSRVEQLAPTSPLPPARQMPIPQAGGMGGRPPQMGQAQGRPQPRPMGGRQMGTQTTTLGITQVPEAKDVQSLMSMLPPEGQAILISLLGGGQYKPPPQSQGQRMG